MKKYEYYRLRKGYRSAGKVRHRSILTLGKLEGVNTKEDKKLLADRVESLVKRDMPLFDYAPSPIIEQYAQAA